MISAPGAAGISFLKLPEAVIFLGDSSESLLYNHFFHLKNTIGRMAASTITISANG